MLTTEIYLNPLFRIGLENKAVECDDSYIVKSVTAVPKRGVAQRIRIKSFCLRDPVLKWSYIVIAVQLCLVSELWRGID